MNLFQKNIIPCNLTLRQALTELNNLPITLKVLICDYNRLAKLDDLPLALEVLYCRDNALTFLDNLPTALKVLLCSDNQLTSLDNLPTALEVLYCEGNNISNTIQISLRFPNLAIIRGCMYMNEEHLNGFLDNLYQKYI